MRSTKKIWHVAIFAIGAFFLLSAIQCKKNSDSKLIFKDDFNRSSFGSDWTINTPSGASFDLSSNMAHPTAGSTTFVSLPKAMYKNKISGGFKVSAKFVISGAANFTKSWAYIVGRATSADTPDSSFLCGYRTYLDTTVVPNKDVYLFGIARVDTGTLGDLGVTTMHTLTPGTTDTIALTFDGNTIKCEMTGNSTISVSLKDGTYGDGYAGFVGGGNTNYVYFDDFDAERI